MTPARRRTLEKQGWVESIDQNEKTMDRDLNIIASLGGVGLNYEWKQEDGIWFIRRIG